MKSILELATKKIDLEYFSAPRSLENSHHTPLRQSSSVCSNKVYFSLKAS